MRRRQRIETKSVRFSVIVNQCNPAAQVERFRQSGVKLFPRRQGGSLDQGESAGCLLPSRAEVSVGPSTPSSNVRLDFDQAGQACRCLDFNCVTKAETPPGIVRNLLQL